MQTNILGIDVAKDKLSLFDSKEKMFVEIPNTEEALLEALQRYGWTPQSHRIGLESTGDYSFLSLQFFTRHDFETILLNPLVTRKYTRSTIRNKKTDRSDAELICEMVDRGEGNRITEDDLDIERKTLLRVEQRLTGLNSDLKRIRKSLELKEKNGINVTTAITEIDRLIGEMKESAKRIFGLAQGEDPSQQESIIRSIPGFGEKLSAIVSSEIGDISRFPSGRQLNAYAGLDPKVIQSGNKDARGRMTKRGNPLLRHALFMASLVASRYDPVLKKYYEKKRAEGKSHTHILCILSRKLCQRIHSMVTHNTMYEVRSFGEVKVLT